MSRRTRRPVSPLEFYGLAGIVIVVAIFFLLCRRYDWDPLEAWLVTVNTIAFLFFAYDKLLAWSGRQRVPEQVLLGFALAGGSPGILAGMLLLWHKIRKASFKRMLAAIMVLQCFVFSIWFFMIR